MNNLVTDRPERAERCRVARGRISRAADVAAVARPHTNRKQCSSADGTRRGTRCPSAASRDLTDAIASGERHVRRGKPRSSVGGGGAV